MVQKLTRSTLFPSLQNSLLIYLWLSQQERKKIFLIVMFKKMQRMILILFLEVRSTLILKMKIRIEFTELFSSKNLRTPISQETLEDSLQKFLSTTKKNTNKINKRSKSSVKRRKLLERILKNDVCCFTENFSFLLSILKS